MSTSPTFSIAAHNAMLAEIEAVVTADARIVITPEHAEVAYREIKCLRAQLEDARRDLARIRAERDQAVKDARVSSALADALIDDGVAEFDALDADKAVTIQ